MSNTDSARATARDIFVREMMTHFDGEAAWAVAVTSDIEQARDYCEIADAILSALTEAGFKIVAVASIANVIDIAEFGQRRLDAGHYRPIIDACRDMLAALAPEGAPDAAS